MSPSRELIKTTTAVVATSHVPAPVRAFRLRAAPGEQAPGNSDLPPLEADDGGDDGPTESLGALARTVQQRIAVATDFETDDTPVAPIQPQRLRDERRERVYDRPTEVFD